MKNLRIVFLVAALLTAFSAFAAPEEEEPVHPHGDLGNILENTAAALADGVQSASTSERTQAQTCSFSEQKEERQPWALQYSFGESEMNEGEICSCSGRCAFGICVLDSCDGSVSCCGACFSSGCRAAGCGAPVFEQE